ncbi:hypothetical protein BH20ACT9_BH20ACT9_14820 [soil metagenome]
MREEGSPISDEDTTSTGDGQAGTDDERAADDRDELEALDDRIADARRRADDVSRESAADPSLHVPRYDMAGEGGTDVEGDTADEGTDADPEATDTVEEGGDGGGRDRGSSDTG